MSVQARWTGVVPAVSSWLTHEFISVGLYGPEMLLTQLVGERFAHFCRPGGHHVEVAGQLSPTSAQLKPRHAALILLSVREAINDAYCPDHGTGVSGPIGGVHADG